MPPRLNTDARPATRRDTGTRLSSPWRGTSRARGNRELKRAALIRAAARAFNERGFHNTSLDDIAAALHVVAAGASD